jgi:hypothetical protein
MQEHTTNDVNALVEELTGVLEDALEDALPLTKQEKTDLKELEKVTVAAMKRVGQRFLELLVQACQPAEIPETILCSCGGTAGYERHREGTVITLMGQIRVERAYYLCPSCQEGTYPLDEKLGFCAGAFSAALQEILAVIGVQVPSFEAASELFERLTLVSISDNGVREATERIGQERVEADKALVEAVWDLEGLEIPEGPSETPERLYGSVDGTSVHTEEGWREAKLGSWYRTDDPLLDEVPEEWKPHAEEITYYGDITEAEEFGRLMYVMGVQRGADRAEELIFIADGAKWIWKLVEEHFPNAIQIVDWYHAAEYIWGVAHAVYGEDSDLAQAWADKRLTELWEGKIEAVISAFRARLNPTLDEDPAQRAITYFQNNRHRMRYPEFRAKGYQIGSGTIESGCKRVIGARLKQAGMIWTFEGARQLIKGRAMYLSGEWDEFCQRRQPPRRTYQRPAA